MILWNNYQTDWFHLEKYTIFNVTSASDKIPTFYIDN